MKLQYKLGFALAGVVAATVFAGCTGGNPAIPTPSPSPSATATPTPYARTTTQKLIFTNLVFQSASSVQGQHYVYVKNLTGADITNFNNYVIAYFPSGANSTMGQYLTSTFNNASGQPITTLTNGGSLKVWLFNNSSPAAGTEAAVSWPTTTVQYGSGGELAIFNSSTASASANLTDYVRWGTATTSIQPLAVQAGLWNSGDTIATVSLATATTGATTSAKVPGGVTLSNWNAFSLF